MSPHCWTPPKSFTLGLYIFEPISMNRYRRRLQMYFFCVWRSSDPRGRGCHRDVSLILLRNPAERRREKAKAEPPHRPVHIKPHRRSKRVYTFLKPFGLFCGGAGGGRFRCDVTFLCNLCTSVSQFHTRCMQIYRVLLIGWFQSGSVVQSCCCWGRTGELPFKMREGAGQKRCGQSWWGWGCVGCGIGAVVQRCNGKRPDSAGGGGGGRVTGVSDITSSPSAFSTPPPPPPFHGATSPMCCRSLQTLMVMFGEYCGDTEKRQNGLNHKLLDWEEH